MHSTLSRSALAVALFWSFPAIAHASNEEAATNAAVTAEADDAALGDSEAQVEDENVSRGDVIIVTARRRSDRNGRATAPRRLSATGPRPFVQRYA